MKNGYDEDRSEGAKIVLKSMGAVVRKQFTRDVTHVVFKVLTFTRFEMCCYIAVYFRMGVTKPTKKQNSLKST